MLATYVKGRKLKKRSVENQVIQNHPSDDYGPHNCIGKRFQTEQHTKGYTKKKKNYIGS